MKKKEPKRLTLSFELHEDGTLAINRSATGFLNHEQLGLLELEKARISYIMNQKMAAESKLQTMKNEMAAELNPKANRNKK